MNKTGKITLTVAIAVVAVLAIVITTLCLIVTKPLAALNNYTVAYVYQNSSDSSATHLSSNVNAQNNTKFKKLLEDCSYSVMQSILSGRTDLENEKYYVEGDEVTLGKNELINSALGLYNKSDIDKSCPKVKLVFDGVQKAVIGKAEYEFDTVEFLVPNTSGEIRVITAIAYKASDYESGSAESDYVSFPVFRFSANTTDLYNFVKGLN